METYYKAGDFIKAGIYIHIPFCSSKCSYCDFYSMVATKDVIDSYTKSLINYINNYPHSLDIDSIYFGGGTPSLLGGDNLVAVKNAIVDKFTFTTGEITLEANPCTINKPLMDTLYKGGFNRLSMGVQSADQQELNVLSRRHSLDQVTTAFNIARESGFDNISLDIMLGLPYQNKSTLEKTIKAIENLSPEHISAYILKVEENTPLAENSIIDHIDEDLQADLYLYCCESLSSIGYNQYEISNFSREDLISHHNYKYWTLAPYIGFGPSAHSYINGKRYYYPRNLECFIDGSLELCEDGTGGDFSEYIMLGLRLNKGVDLQLLQESFPQETKSMLIKAKPLLDRNILNIKDNHLSIDYRYFLLSNTIINQLI